MICKNCGTILEENSNTCPICGTQITEDNNHKEKQFEKVEEPTAKKYSGKAIAGFVLSLIGIIVFAVPCGILGLVFSALAMKEVESSQYGKAFVISGLVISIIDIVLGIIYLAL